MITAKGRMILAAVMLLTCAASGAEAPAPAPAGYHVGFCLVRVPRAGQDALLVAVWYPTEAGRDAP